MYYSKETIQFNYNKAISQAKELENLASQLESLAKRDVDDTLMAVSRGWSGDSSDLFVGKGRKAQGDMRASAKQLRNLAEGIRIVAKNVRNAEERARLIALNISGRGTAGGGGFSSGGGGGGGMGSW